MLTEVLPAALRADLEAIRAGGLPTTPTGRSANMTRRRRAAVERPRIARRFVPRHSLAITLDWALSPSERLVLPYLLSLPRDGLAIYSMSAGLLASAFGVVPRTAWRWLHGLEDAGYLHVRPGRVRGSLVILFSAKATRWLQLGAGDLAKPQKKENRSQPRLSEPSGTPSSASKVNSKKEASEGRDEGAAGLLARIAARVQAARGTDMARYWQRIYAEALARERLPGSAVPKVQQQRR